MVTEWPRKKKSGRGLRRSGWFTEFKREFVGKSTQRVVTCKKRHAHFDNWPQEIQHRVMLEPFPVCTIRGIGWAHFFVGKRSELVF